MLASGWLSRAALSRHGRGAAAKGAAHERWGPDRAGARAARGALPFHAVRRPHLAHPRREQALRHPRRRHAPRGHGGVRRRCRGATHRHPRGGRGHRRSRRHQRHHRARERQLAQSPLVLLGGATATVPQGARRAAGHRPAGLDGADLSNGCHRAVGPARSAGKLDRGVLRGPGGRAGPGVPRVPRRPALRRRRRAQLVRSAQQAGAEGVARRAGAGGLPALAYALAVLR